MADQKYSSEAAIEATVPEMKMFRREDENLQDVDETNSHEMFLVFACSDSRVSPSRILDFKPGVAFETRNLSCFRDPLDTLERVQLLNTQCQVLSDFVHEWIKIGLPAKAKVMAEAGDEPLEKLCSICEREAVNLSLVNLLTYPYVQARVAKGTLKLMGGHYDFVHGKFELWGFNAETIPLLCI
ncbi:carbonic anhydrase 1 [Actinidia rufa]|uniref:Carbonic anhydrase n=1 Tax=Actinidia rufa TaxID=165716 RepID=A0A7J0FZ49_9ERIC|nr:carbonic anhydrase 1 [Actinidia rufa]